MTNDWPSIVIGMQLLLGMQLLVVGLLHLIGRFEHKKEFLGILCLIHGLWFFKHVFAGLWEDHLLLFLVIGPGKPIYVGSILLLYFESFSGPISAKKLVLHMVLPTSYYLSLLALRFFHGNQDSESMELMISIGFSIAAGLIFWFYFLLTKREISNKVRHQLIPRVYKRLRLLFYSLYFFLLQIPVWDIFEKLNNSTLLSPNTQSIIDLFYTNFFQYTGYYASYLYINILGYFIILYALSELPYVKKFLLPNETSLQISSEVRANNFRSNLNNYFHKQKAFLNPNLTVDISALALGISKMSFAQLFKQTIDEPFKDFVNRLRVEEFKRLILDESNQKYDLVGLAFKCGFNSKATFFRVFKEKEGMTPGEYKRLSIDSNASDQP